MYMYIVLHTYFTFLWQTLTAKNIPIVSAKICTYKEIMRKWNLKSTIYTTKCLFCGKLDKNRILSTIFLHIDLVFASSCDVFSDNKFCLFVITEELNFDVAPATTLHTVNKTDGPIWTKPQPMRGRQVNHNRPIIDILCVFFLFSLIAG